MTKHRPTPVLATALALAIGGAALTGCVAPQSNNDEVLAKLDEMQAQIDKLKAGQEASAADDAASKSADDAATNGSTNGTDYSVTAGSGVDEFTARVDDLAQRADEAAATAASAAVPQDPANRPKAYFDAKAPLEELDHELDRLDDAIEAAYAQGSITREDVWTLEQREDAIDDVLDRAEDDLELRMGVDD